jgi:hypothetical protein
VGAMLYFEAGSIIVYCMRFIAYISTVQYSQSVVRCSSYSLFLSLLLNCVHATTNCDYRRRRITAYQSCNPAVTELLYVHPQSNLYRSDPTAPLPEYVVYGQLVRSHRGDTTYMSCVSAVDAGWIAPVLLSGGAPPMLHWGAPLQSPQPVYDAAADAIMCYAAPSYGAHSWQLPPMKRPLLHFFDGSSAGNDLSSGPSFSVSSSSSKSAVGFRHADEPYRYSSVLCCGVCVHVVSCWVVIRNY